MTIEPLISGYGSFLFPQKDEGGREREGEKTKCIRKAFVRGKHEM